MKHRLGRHRGRGRRGETFEESIARLFHLDDSDSDAVEPIEDPEAERAKLLAERSGRPKLRGNVHHRRILRAEALRDRLEGAEMLAFLVPRKLKEKLKWAAHYNATTMRALGVKAIRHYLAKHADLPPIDDE